MRRGVKSDKQYSIDVFRHQTFFCASPTVPWMRLDEATLTHSPLTSALAEGFVLDRNDGLSYLPLRFPIRIISPFLPVRRFFRTPASKDFA